MCYLRSDRSKQKGYYDERNSLYLCALHPLRAEITKRGRFNLSPNPICAFKNSTRNATVISLIQPACFSSGTPTYQRMRIHLSLRGVRIYFSGCFRNLMGVCEKYSQLGLYTPSPRVPSMSHYLSQSPFPVTKAS